MPRKVKIARVIARLNLGGPAIQSILMTEVLRQRGYETLLLAGEVPPYEHSIESMAVERGIQPIKLTTMSRNISVMKDLISLFKLFRLFRRERPDIVHTHTAKAGTLGRIAAILARAPIRVHTFHGHVFHGYFSPAVTRVFLFIERMLARHTTRIIAVSETQRKELIERYRVAPAAKVVTVPLGFELDSFLRVNGQQGKLRSTIGCAQEVPLIGWVGRLTPVKDPLLLVEAIHNLHAQAPNVRVVIVGDGELRPQIEKVLGELRLQNVVSMVGWCSDMPAVLADVDFLLLTSLNEGTPLALLEAMAAGKPFVAPDVGGVRDLMVGPEVPFAGGRLFQNGVLTRRDPQEIAKALLYLLQNLDARKRMGSHARQWVSQTFSHSSLADRLEQLYAQLMQEQRVHR